MKGSLSRSPLFLTSIFTQSVNDVTIWGINTIRIQRSLEKIKNQETITLQLIRKQLQSQAAGSINGRQAIQTHAGERPKSPDTKKVRKSSLLGTRLLLITGIQLINLLLGLDIIIKLRMRRRAGEGRLAEDNSVPRHLLTPHYSVASLCSCPS